MRSQQEIQRALELLVWRASTGGVACNDVTAMLVNVLEWVADENINGPRTFGCFVDHLEEQKKRSESIFLN